MAGGAGDKTEAPTPKKLGEAKKNGQVARSADLNGAISLFAGLFALGSYGPALVGHARHAMVTALGQAADPSAVSISGAGTLLSHAGTDAALAVAPIALACMGAGVLANVGQIGLRLNLGAMKPKPSKLNPVSGFKSIYGPNSVVETAKSLSKVSVVGVIVATTVLPQVTSLGGLVGIGPFQLGTTLASTIMALARKAAVAYLLIGLADFAYQKRRFVKQLRMTKQEVRDESKNAELPAEVRGAIRRRQMAASRARMMAAVPTADVVVTNPTHFSVALRYDGTAPAPEVIAKGQDLVALRIREIAREAGVPIVPDPPLARSLHATVEVGQQIPEELFQAVAQVLAYVYRVAARRRAA